MQIALPVLRRCLNGFTPETALHVGAHQAEEAEMYEALGVREVHWVEAQPELCSQLQRKLNPATNFIYNAAVWSKGGVKKEFLITNNSLSSSLFTLKSHLEVHPEVEEISRLQITTSRLDEILPRKKFDLINVDVQGAEAELQALQGLGDLLRETQLIYLEVNKAELYEGIDLVPAVDCFLAGEGFRRVVTLWVPRKGWGEAIYMRDVTAPTVFAARFINLYYFTKDILRKLRKRVFS